MKKMNVINCKNKTEMNLVADQMIERGFSVKTIERMMPFQQYGIGMPVYKVLFWEEQENKKSIHILVLFNPFIKENKSIWRSGLQKTSVLSESSTR